MFVTIGARNFWVVPGVLREITEEHSDLVQMIVRLCAEAVAQQSLAASTYGEIYSGLDLNFHRLKTIDYLNGNIFSPLQICVDNSIYQGPKISPALHSLRLLLTDWADQGIAAAKYPVSAVVHASWLAESHEFFTKKNEARYARISTMALDFAELKLQANADKVARLISLLPQIR